MPVPRQQRSEVRRRLSESYPASSTSHAASIMASVSKSSSIDSQSTLGSDSSQPQTLAECQEFIRRLEADSVKQTHEVLVVLYCCWWFCFIQFPITVVFHVSLLPIPSFYYLFVARWCSGRAPDSWSRGRGFDSSHGIIWATTLGKLFTPNVPLVPCKGLHAICAVLFQRHRVQWTRGVL